MSLSGRVPSQTINNPGTCAECGGPIALVAKAGRYYRTANDEIKHVPADMVIPTCTACGCMWIDTIMARRHEQ